LLKVTYRHPSKPPVSGTVQAGRIKNRINFASFSGYRATLSAPRSFKRLPIVLTDYDMVAMGSLGQPPLIRLLLAMTTTCDQTITYLCSRQNRLPINIFTSTLRINAGPFLHAIHGVNKSQALPTSGNG
jgi:hypothetical protein